MTALLDRPASHAAPEPVSPPSRFAGWRGRWRVALLLARRDAWRGKGRALLVIAIIALPVAAATGVVVYGQSVQEVTGSRHSALISLGTTADARIMVTSPPVVQAVTAWNTVDGGGDKPVASVAAIEAALPAGSHAVSTGGLTTVVLESGPWGVQGNLTLQDTRDPLNAGRWTMAEGRLPTSSGEVAVAADTLARLQASVGSTLVATSTVGAEGTARLTVVGSFERTDTGNGGDAVALPGVLPTDPATAAATGNELLVASPQPWTWSDVRRVNAVGGIVLARAVLESPPSFCDLDSRCVDAGIDPTWTVGAATPIALEEAARFAALIAVAFVLIVLQVALLAGPAFAVQLRRRQRELGLLGASGADAATLRRTVLASGLVLGIVGGLVGMAVGWAAVWLLGGALPVFAPLEQGGRSLGVPPLPWYVVGIALIGVISATAAALVPAVVAGRGEVLDTLRGRRPLPAVRTRTPVLGVLSGLVGLGLLVYGRSSLDALILGTGIVLAELGLVLVMPWLVVRVSALGRFLPLTPRLALRDAGRHRLRTAMAACAIAAAAAAAVATSTWQTSQTLQVESAGRPYLDGTVQVQVGVSAEGGAVPVDPAQRLADTRRVIETVAPGSASVSLRDVVTSEANPADEAKGAYGSLTCVRPEGAGPPRDEAAAGALQGCGTIVSPAGDGGPGVTSYQSFGISAPVALIEDPASLAGLLGPLVNVDDAVAALRRGEAVATIPGIRDAQGRVWLRPEPVTVDSAGNWNQAIRPPVAVPAVEAVGGTTPTAVLVGPAAFAPGGALAGVAKPQRLVTLLVVTPSVPDRADRPTVVDQLSIALAKARVSAQVMRWNPSFYQDNSVALVLAAASVGTLLMALLAGLMVTALAMADAKSDLVTLAAVGAAPRVRRRMAAASAGTVAALGCAAGVVSGLVVARLLVGLFYYAGGRAFEIRWWLVGFVLVAIPLITAGVAWLTTRSKVVIPRRSDS